MSTPRSRKQRTVIIERPDGEHVYEYETLGEAKRQADRWLGEALRFIERDGIDFYVIRLGPTTWHVLSYASSGGVDVIEESPDDRRFWSRGELHACYDRRWRHVVA